MAPFGFVPGITLFLLRFEVVCDISNSFILKSWGERHRVPSFCWSSALPTGQSPGFRNKQESSELEGRRERGIGAGPAWLQVWSLLLTSCTAVSPSVEWAPALLRDRRIKWASLRGGLEWWLAAGELATSFSLTSHLRSDSPPQAQPPQVKNQEGDSLGGVGRGGPRSCADWRQHSLAQRSF